MLMTHSLLQVCCPGLDPGTPSTQPFTQPFTQRPFTPRPQQPFTERPFTERPATQRPPRPRPPLDDRPVNVQNDPNLRLLPHDVCGPGATNRIINGNKTNVFEFPWMARLGYTSSRKRFTAPTTPTTHNDPAARRDCATDDALAPSSDHAMPR